jgi:hypothetical protein
VTFEITNDSALYAYASGVWHGEDLERLLSTAVAPGLR